VLRSEDRLVAFSLVRVLPLQFHPGASAIPPPSARPIGILAVA
jgi:hypothetical protein